MNLIEALTATNTSAHKQYLKTWSIITAGAENGGTYSNELLYQVIQNQQEIAADLEMLANLTTRLVEQLEKQTDSTFEF